jgi:hypothetical protein
MQGKSCSGLHVWGNLQILEASVNLSKNAKHPVDTIADGWLFANA